MPIRRIQAVLLVACLALCGFGPVAGAAPSTGEGWNSTGFHESGAAQRALRGRTIVVPRNAEIRVVRRAFPGTRNRPYAFGDLIRAYGQQNTGESAVDLRVLGLRQEETLQLHRRLPPQLQNQVRGDGSKDNPYVLQFRELGSIVWPEPIVRDQRVEAAIELHAGQLHRALIRSSRPRGPPESRSLETPGLDTRSLLFGGPSLFQGLARTDNATEEVDQTVFYLFEVDRLDRVVFPRVVGGKVSTTMVDLDADLAARLRGINLADSSWMQYAMSSSKRTRSIRALLELGNNR